MTTETVTAKKKHAKITTTTINYDLLAKFKLEAERDWERRHPILVFFKWLWRAL